MKFGVYKGSGGGSFGTNSMDAMVIQETMYASVIALALDRELLLTPSAGKLCKSLPLPEKINIGAAGLAWVVITPCHAI